LKSLKRFQFQMLFKRPVQKATDDESGGAQIASAKSPEPDLRIHSFRYFSIKK